MQHLWRTEVLFREPEAEVLRKNDAFWPADFGFLPSKKHLGNLIQVQSRGPSAVVILFGLGWAQKSAF